MERTDLINMDLTPEQVDWLSIFYVTGIVKEAMEERSDLYPEGKKEAVKRFLIAVERLEKEYDQFRKEYWEAK